MQDFFVPQDQSYLTPQHGDASFPQNTASTDFDDEEPLLKELGIEPREILRHAAWILHPLRAPTEEVQANSDLAGPLAFCLMLGGLLLLSGKVHFSYIYGFAIVGAFCIYAILNLMSDGGISFDRTSSILGYSLLPVVILSCFGVFMSMKGLVGIIMTAICIAWCSFSATRFIETVLNMKEQRWLIAYPLVLVYCCFALLVVG